MQEKNLNLKKIKIGSRPFIDQVLKKIELDRVLGKFISNKRHISALAILVRSLLLEPAALYRVPKLAEQWGDIQTNDDLLARALDGLFKADRASLQTTLSLKAISAYQIDTSFIHNDSTSVKFFGEYKIQSNRAVKLKRGHSKDHRPDLKQLVYSLSVCGDGAVPIHFKCHDGNETDDKTHIETWLTLRGALGKSDFVYVADSKLCTSENMRKIDKEQGRFVTIVPRTRSEVKEFYNECYEREARWKILTKYASTRKKGSFDVFQTSSDFHQLSEGFRMFWYRSSEKKKRDKESRENRIAAAMEKLQVLKERGAKTEKALLGAAKKILNRFQTISWIHIEIKLKEVERFTQESPGRPKPGTKYTRTVKNVPYLVFKKNRESIAQSLAIDGIFPLATNTKMDEKETLQTYKYQPRIEKRFSYIKSDYQISPVFFKKTERIESLMFVCFISSLVAAIIQRQIQIAMKNDGIKKIRTLPEDRPTATPTWEQIQRLFANHFRQELTESGVKVAAFWDELSHTQAQVIKLMGVSRSEFLG